MLELRICGGVEVEVDGRRLPDALLGGRQGRLVLAFLACERHRAVRREELADLLWPDTLPESWTASLSAVVSRLRRLFTEAGLDGPSVVVSVPGAYQLVLPHGASLDLDDLVAAVDEAEEAATVGAVDRVIAAATRADAIAARGFLADDGEWIGTRRDAMRDLRVRAVVALSAAHLAADAPARAIEAARRAVELDDIREASYRQLMLALAATGERAEALRVWERCRVTLTEELGVDPSPETEAVYLGLLDSTAPDPVTTALPTGVVTFLLTDIVESSALWEEHTSAMAAALERHDEIVGTTVAAHGGTLLKSKLEGDATVSVFARATEGAAAALALLDAIDAEPWPEGASPRLRMAMHTGEAFERGGDYFGPALNRAARLRSLARPNEVLLSQAVAEVVRDHLPAEVVLSDRGHQTLRGLSRGEHVFQLTHAGARPHERTAVGEEDLVRPPVPTALSGTGPFVGRAEELARLAQLWERAAAGEPGAALIGGEPGVGKSRLAGEIARRAHSAGALVLYGRCDEELAAPLQPFLEAVRVLAPALGASRLRAVRGIDELTRVAPEVSELLGEAPATGADPDTERLALFDSVARLLDAASSTAPVLLVLDDLHWAGKSTLSLLHHVLRRADNSRLLVIGTYRDTELARTHPLAETLADLRRDADPLRIALAGLAAEDVEAYLTAIGHNDHALGRELAEVTAGNPFFLIEVVRHVEESGGSWQSGSLPEGVREATGRRLSRLSDAANEALAVAAVVGTTFDLALVEQVLGIDLVDPIGEAVQAGLVVDEPGSLARFRFAHAIVRQVLLAELVSLKRVRLHHTIAELLEVAPLPADPDERLTDLAYHWFECASAGSADRAVEACRGAADRAMERLAYEEAADLYGMALQALEWVGAPEETGADLHLARCDALLTAGDVAGARDAIDALELAAAGSERLAAWYTTYEGLLAVLGEPDRLTEIVQSIAAAAGAMSAIGDLTGEAKARYVHAVALERLGRIGAAEQALDAALAAARSADDRRLADSILAEAPPAALWGPSPVTRASGRCLDVVRVLRITSGTAAVEVVALRCQALLEALRGRMDAARRMIGSATRSVEQLGLTHRRLETELTAGLVELLDGQAAVAEAHLRTAYEGLRERGLDGDAAQAAAFLGRALLLEGRVDEADDAAAAAEALAGSDLKAAIAWRDVRAEAAARRGETDRALALAREAVEMASATDALLLVADARLALAAVLRATGDLTAADDEARRAVEACEAKGATAMAARAREAMSTPEPDAELDDDVVPSAHGAEPPPNRSFATVLRIHEAFNRGDFEGLHALQAVDWKMDDRRPVVGLTMAGDAGSAELFAYPGGGRFDRPALLATRGDDLALCRWVLRKPALEVPLLGITRVDAQDRLAEFVMFEPEATDDALAVLDAMATRTVFENDATRYFGRYESAHRARDWDAVVAGMSEEWIIDDRRRGTRVVLDHDQSIASERYVFDGHGDFMTEAVATRGRSLALARITLRIPAPEATDTVLTIVCTDDAGRCRSGTCFDIDDLDGAMAELDRMFLEAEGAEHAGVIELAASLIDAMVRYETASERDLFAPGSVVRSHRHVGVAELPGDEWLRMVEENGPFYGGGDVRVLHVADLSHDGGLWACLAHGESETGGSWEIPFLIALRVAGGRVEAADFFETRDVIAARARLIERRRSVEAQFENAATRVQARFEAAFHAQDWDGLVASYAEDYTIEDRRSLIRVTLDREQTLDTMRMIFFDGRGRVETDILATRGDSLLLLRTTLRVRDPEAAMTTLAVNRVDDAGRLVRGVMFDADDLDGAFAELDRMFLEEERAEHARVIELVTSLFDALGRRDLAAAQATLAPGFVAREHGPVAAPELTADEWIGSLVGTLSVFGSVGLRVEHVSDLSRDGGVWAMLTHGEHADGGGFELPWLMAVCVVDGRIVSIDSWEPSDVDAARAVLAAHRRALTDLTSWCTQSEAWRATLRMNEAVNRRDWDVLVDVFDPAFVHVDRTRLGPLVVGDHRRLRQHEALLGSEQFRLENELLATRGEHLALTRDRVWLIDDAVGPSELEYVSVVECGSDGRIVSVAFHDADDIVSALDLLDARYVELGGGDFGSMRRAFAARDWETFASGFEGSSVADHRTAGWGIVDSDTVVDYQRSVVELAPDAQLWIDHTRARGEVSISAGRISGTRDGAPWEIAFVTIGVATPDRRSSQFENYEVADLAVARQRFEELAAEFADESAPDVRM